MKVKIIVLILIQIFLGSLSLSGQTTRSFVPKQNLKEKEQKTQIRPETEFENIINGLTNGNTNQISRYFSQQVYLSLRSGERGYYSSNQAYYLIDNFFNIYQPISFQITSRMFESSIPYLAGKLYCRFKGSIEVFQLYLSLSWNGNRWEITQISIN